ncbi:Transposon Ty3-G Gag-Pol polyprotein [Stylophora pistillata]|uniref:Transposon Ty3-G Gag-Pol polyprotein n=1 Tax=Stylophora pistillata TaxID=50429 RepID=A0A2B4RMW2_STYPI|nr:Transposon Ty3-G Gag-Pol polyprotein [Stylophora pistillata]
MHIDLDPSVTPVHAPSRRVPVAKLNRVNEELERLCVEGIIRPVTQSTDWFSNMLVKEKPNGKLRICINPSQTINKTIKRPKYTKPTIEERLPLLTNAKMDLSPNLVKPGTINQIREETGKDPLNKVVLSSWPCQKNEVPEEIRAYWDLRDEISDVQDIFVTLSDSGAAPEEETQYPKAMRLLDAIFCHKLASRLNDISSVKQNRKSPRQQTSLRPDCSSLARIASSEHPRKNKYAISSLINVGPMIFARNYSLSVSNGRDIPTVDIEVGGVRLEGVLVDSGSTCNAIDRATLERLKEKKVKCVSRKSNIKLYSYESNEPLTTAAREILSRETSEELAILKLEINAMEEENLLRDFSECFEGAGKLKGFQAKLHVDTSIKPVAQKLRPPPYGLRDKIEQKLKELVNCDIIEPVEGPTPWVSPVVVVPKPSGDIRLCVDMRKANEAIVRERHPIPTVDDILYQMNGSKVFSKLDLKWGFHHIELEQQSRVITTFITHKGLYGYKRLTFGISSAPELYHHNIQQVLAGCEGAYNIYDDIIIHGRTVEEHDSRLQKTIECISDKGLTLNPDKCVFRMLPLTFMGYLLLRKGIGPTESRVDAVVRAKEPTNAEEVRSFLGLVNFSARFIPNLVSMSERFRELTRKDVPFKWGTEQGATFEILKNASPVGLGAVLTQVQEGQERVIAYASRAFTGVESRHSQKEREALELVWGCDRFHMYLYGMEFILLTDHKPLETIYSTSYRNLARIERWVLRLQPYRIRVEYVPSKQNIADSLSRRVGKEELSSHNDAEEFIRSVAETSAPVAIPIKEIERESATDPEISQLQECVLTGDWDKAPPQYKQVRNELSFLGKLVLRGTRLLIPRRLRERVLDLAHEGHQGLVKTKQRLRTKVWWAGIDKQVENRCNTCHGCQLVGLPTPPEPLRHTQFPSQPWIDLAADLVAPLPSGEYVLVVVDYYSRYFELDILTSVTSTKVIESLDKIFCTHGLPQSLKTDNGSQFVSDEFERFLETNDIEHRTSTPHGLRQMGREIRSKIPELGNSRYSDSETRDKDVEIKLERTDFADGKMRVRESELDPGVNMRRNVADVKKYLREDTTADEQVVEDDPSEEDDTGRRTEPQGRPVRERRPPENLKDFEGYELCLVKE